MAPAAEIDDGHLDIIVLNEISRLNLLRLFPSIFRGDHVKDEAVEVFRGSTVSIKSEKAMALTPDGKPSVPLPST